MCISCPELKLAAVATVIGVQCVYAVLRDPERSCSSRHGGAICISGPELRLATVATVTKMQQIWA